MRLLPLLGAVAALGCGSTVLDAAKFEKSCDTPAQCRPVTFGDICQPCTCQNGAVNEQGFAKYQVDRGAITCPPSNTVVQCGACNQPLVACVDGGCVLQ